MIFSIARTALVALRRDRASLALSFVLPIAFFTIFAAIFGGQHDTTPRVTVIVVDQDQSHGSRQLVQALQREARSSPDHPLRKRQAGSADYTAETAEAAVKAGDAPVALIIPRGYGAHPMSFGPDQGGSAIQMLNDKSDSIAPQVVAGLLQKVAMTAMPVTMAEQGMTYTGQYVGGFTPRAAEAHGRRARRASPRCERSQRHHAGISRQSTTAFRESSRWSSAPLSATTRMTP